MQPEGSLPHSQMPATCPYPEPARSSPCLHIPLPEDPSQYYPRTYAWVSQVVSFPRLSTPKSFKGLSPPPYALHASPSQTTAWEVSSRTDGRGYVTYSAFKKVTWPGKTGLSFSGYRLHSWDNRLIVHSTLNRCPAGYQISAAHWLTPGLTNACDAIAANLATN